MKKLLLVFGILVGLVGQGVAQMRAVENYSFFTFTTADTLTVVTDDGVCGIAIYVPSSSTDTCIVSGVTKVVSGITSNGVKLAPGDRLSFGGGANPITYVRIIIRGKANIAFQYPGRSR